MNIKIEKTMVEFIPDNHAETQQLEALWRLMVDCARYSRKLVPIGEYVPIKRNVARFAVEDNFIGSAEITEKVADADGRYVCFMCNTYVELKKGDPVPLCCGKLMECFD